MRSAVAAGQVAAPLRTFHNLRSLADGAPGDPQCMATPAYYNRPVTLRRVPHGRILAKRADRRATFVAQVRFDLELAESGVLPLPPGPVSVRRRCDFSSRRISVSSSYRVPSAIQRVGSDSEATFTARGRAANRFRAHYFPTREFDEWHIVDHWAFARHGDGYVALGSESALAQCEDSRELRPSDPGHVWVCRLGGRATDGSCAAFMARLRASRLELSTDLGVRWTADDRVLELRHTGPLLVDGAAQPPGPYQSFDSPYAYAELGHPRLLMTTGDEQLEAGPRARRTPSRNLHRRAPRPLRGLSLA